MVFGILCRWIEPFVLCKSFIPMTAIIARRLADLTGGNFRLEILMLKKLLTVTVLAIATGTPLLAGGCASDNDKGTYGLTGTDHQMTAQERARYTDQKGHYRPEWVGQENR